MAVQFNNKSSSPAPELGQPVSAEIAYSLDQFMSKEFPQVIGTLRGFQHLPGLSLMGFSKLSVVKSLCTVLQKNKTSQQCLLCWAIWPNSAQSMLWHLFTGSTRLLWPWALTGQHTDVNTVRCSLRVAFWPTWTR